jgi:hypothetical protein
MNEGIFAAYRNGVDLRDAAKFSADDAQLLAARLRDALLSPDLTRADTIEVISPSAAEGTGGFAETIAFTGKSVDKDEVTGECTEPFDLSGKNSDTDAGVRDNATGIAGPLRTFGGIAGPPLTPIFDDPGDIADPVPIGTAGPLPSSIFDDIANIVPFGIAGPPLTSISDGIAGLVPISIAGPPLTSIFEDPGKHHASAPRPPKQRPSNPPSKTPSNLHANQVPRRPRPRGSGTALRLRTGIVGHALLRRIDGDGSRRSTAHF